MRCQWRIVRVDERQRVLAVQRTRLEDDGSLEPRGDEAGVHIPAGRYEEPRQLGDLARQVAQQLGRCLVHPVRVLGDEEGSSTDDPAEEIGGHLLQARAAETALEPSDLCGLGHLDPDQHPEERQPARELRGDAEYGVAQGLLDHLRVGGRIEAEQRAHRLMEGEVRRGGLVLLADQLDKGEVVRLRRHFLDEPRFADAGLADELDEPTRAAARDVERMTEDRELSGRVPRAAWRSSCVRPCPRAHRARTRRRAGPCP